MPLRKNKISVILPNYNHGQYICRAVEAILGQDHLPCEIIIVDDGSTDDSLTIINALAAASPLIRVFENSTNEGLVAAQSRVLAAVTGRYIHLAAADDTVLPGFYSLAVDMLDRYPEAGLFAGDSLLFDGVTGRFLSVRPIVMPRVKAGYLSPAQTRKALAHSDNWILTGASVIRADALIACGGLDKNLGSFADGYLTRKIALARGFCYAPELVSTWNIFPTGASRSTALDPTRAAALCDTTVARIAADPIFPAWYAKRFADRWRFATARLVLNQDRIDAPTVLALGAKSRIDKIVLGIVLAASKGLFGKLAASAWLYLRFRPYRLIDIAMTFAYRKLLRIAHSGVQNVDDLRGNPHDN